MPKVSIIIPTYNRAQSLRSAITSVLNQTYQDFEIIIVDDASSDTTGDLVRNLRDRRIKYIRHAANKGEAGSRNTGVTNSTGQFIAFLDDDDEWMPTKLEKQVNLLEASPPIVGGAYTGFWEIHRDGGRIIDQSTPSKRGDIFREMATENWVGTPSTVILRRECFDKVGLFDENIEYGPDYDMWIRISKEFHFEYIKDPLVKYYQHGVKLSTNYAKLIKGNEAKLRKYAAYFALDTKSYSHRFIDLGVFYCCSGNLRKGREAFIKAIKIYPFQTRHYFTLCASFLGTSNFKRLKQAKERLTLEWRLNDHS